MELDKNKKYFISKNEFKEMNKNPFIAGILAIYLGIFGVHRFYLNRELSGAIILMVSLLSLLYSKGYILIFIILILIIEGIVYISGGVILFREKRKKNKYIEKSYEINNEEKIDIEKDIEIIEVSDVKPSKISRKDKINKNDKNKWLIKLKIPYERNIMEVEQVKEETLNFYKKLCDFIDEELRVNKSSLNKEISRIEFEGGYYNNILYTIYCISEGHVSKRYSGDYSYYNPNYSYGLLEDHLGKKIKEKVFIKAQELEKNISPPKKETKIYFELTENGLPMKWWDKDGKLRASRDFTNEELNILNITPSRTTIIWDIYGAKKQIINLYFEIFQIIFNGLVKNIEWKSENKKTLFNMISGNDMYYVDDRNGKILSSLIKISENTIREIMPNTQTLDISSEKKNIKKYLPNEIVKDIDNKLLEFKENIEEKDLKEILEDMIQKNPDDWKLKAEKILIYETDKAVNILIDYKDDKNFIKILKNVIKKTNDENLLLLCLYGIGLEEKSSQKNIKLLENIIHPSNISKYENIIGSKEILSLELLNKLIEFKNPVRKKIEIDMDKVGISKKELNKTVEIIEEYIGDDEVEEKLEEDIEDKLVLLEYNEENKSEKDNEFKYIDFIKLILDEEVIDIEEANKIAMKNGKFLNTFISDVNRELYEYVQDQTIVIEEEYIKIDDFYIDMIEELVINE